jgi:hypothetical protein
MDERDEYNMQTASIIVNGMVQDVTALVRLIPSGEGRSEHLTPIIDALANLKDYIREQMSATKEAA